jgi:AcrR family transcriptional regulator
MALSAADGSVAERILDTAILEFSEHGFAGARIDRIAGSAGVSPRSIYYHFGNKEELYDAVFEHVRALHQAEWLQAVNAGDLQHQLLASLQQTTRERWQRWARLAMWDSLQPVKRRMADPSQFTNSDLAALKLAQDNGEISADLDIHMLALAFTAIRFYPMVLPDRVVDMGLKPGDPEFFDRQAALVELLVGLLRSR